VVILAILEAIMSAKFDRITVDPGIMNGQPCIRNMRLPVRRVVEAVALYPDWDELQVELRLKQGALVSVTDSGIRIRNIPLFPA